MNKWTSKYSNIHQAAIISKNIRTEISYQLEISPWKAGDSFCKPIIFSFHVKLWRCTDPCPKLPICCPPLPGVSPAGFWISELLSCGTLYINVNHQTTSQFFKKAKTALKQLSTTVSFKILGILVDKRLKCHGLFHSHFVIPNLQASDFFSASSHPSTFYKTCPWTNKNTEKHGKKQLQIYHLESTYSCKCYTQNVKNLDSLLSYCWWKKSCTTS